MSGEVAFALGMGAPLTLRRWEDVDTQEEEKDSIGAGTEYGRVTWNAVWVLLHG